MRNVRITICLVAVAVILSAAQAFGTVEFKDGLVHNINYTISDTVWVDNASPGIATTVNMLPGCSINNDLSANYASKLNISGGSVQHIIHSGLEGYINITGGTVTQLNIYATTTISGGTVGSIYASNAYTTSSLTITGGRVNYLNDGIGVISIYGGSIGTISCDGNGGGVLAGVNKIFGSNFAINGTPIGYGQYSHISGTLTGTLANGNFLNTSISIYGPASLTLIPEPATMSLFALAGLLIRNKK